MPDLVCQGQCTSSDMITHWIMAGIGFSLDLGNNLRNTSWSMDVEQRNKVGIRSSPLKELAVCCKPAISLWRRSLVVAVMLLVVDR